ncbi:hypothetical protein JCM24511_05649 [Saitozyma sp. JCM 24511]|nr:hypothetical protein JCM24511_05649 [Saitozyma sp. JCM 24511]
MAKRSTAVVHPATTTASVGAGREPLPHAYWWFFQIIEPLLTFGGAFFAMFQPAKYAADLLPPEVERLTQIMGETSRGGIVIGTLGSYTRRWRVLPMPGVSYARALEGKADPVVVDADMGGRHVGRMMIGPLGPRFFLIGLTEFSLVWTVTHHVTSLAAQEKIFRGFMICLCLADWTHIILTLLPLPISHLQSPGQWTYLLHGNATLTFSAFLIRQEPLPSEPAPRSPQRSARAGTHPVSPVTPAKALAAEGGEVEEREKEKTKGSVRRRARGT